MPNQFLSPEGDLENYFITEYWLIDQYVGDTLWVWGQNVSAQLGVNDTNIRTTPVTTFAGGSNWVAPPVTNAGRGQSAGIKTDGTLWTWGVNSDARLGVNDTVNRLTPVTTFAGGTNWKQVSCGFSHSAAIKTDGTMWIWGVNSNGALGINDNNTRTTPVTTFAGGANWKQVSCGNQTTAAIKIDGTLWIWGYNFYGQLGDNTVTDKLTPITTFLGGNNWKQVGCGSSHSAAITTTGTLWDWGLNSYGQLGNNTTTNRLTPITTFAGGTNWKQVILGNLFTAAIKSDGTLWTWGKNLNGQLGDNTTTNKTTPVTTFLGGTNWKQVGCGAEFMAATKTDGTLWNWGLNGTGQLGVNDIISRSTPVTTIIGGTNWKQLSCGGAYVVAVTSGTNPTFFIA
jgi:alpha-tubulin suppressor-like RCC1 family protein